MKKLAVHASVLTCMASMASLWGASAPYYSSWARVGLMHTQDALALETRNTAREGVITKHLMSLGMHSQEDIVDQMARLQLECGERYVKTHAAVEQKESYLNGFIRPLKALGEPGTPYALGTYQTYYVAVMKTIFDLETTELKSLSIPSSTLAHVYKEHLALQEWAENATSEQLHAAYHQERDSLQNMCVHVKKYNALHKRAMTLMFCAAYLGVLDGQDHMYVSSPELDSVFKHDDYYAKCVAAKGKAGLREQVNFTLSLDGAKSIQPQADPADCIVEAIWYMWGKAEKLGIRNATGLGEAVSDDDDED